LSNNYDRFNCTGTEDNQHGTKRTRQPEGEGLKSRFFIFWSANGIIASGCHYEKGARRDEDSELMCRRFMLPSR
jgi:hypothetical protein